MVFKQKILDFFRTVFPSTRFEALLFAVFFLAYGALATTIALHYRIIFDDRIPWDAYFSFDNRSVVLTGGSYERHPLSNYFFQWLRDFALVFSGGQKNEVFRLVLALCSAAAISLANLQIYKYLKNIISLPKKFSLLLVAFYAVFSTNILLSFTPETYTYTLLFLSLFAYYVALKFKKDKKIPAAALALAGISIGGLTVTNIVKVYLPVVFENRIFKSWRSFLNATARVLISAAIFIFLFLYRMNFKSFDFFNKSGQQLDKFSTPKETPVWDMIASWFFGGTVFFSGFHIRDFHSKTGFQFKALFMKVYDSGIAYYVIGLLVLLLLWSYGKNFKNRLVQLLAISLLIDIIIHCVLKFGLHTAYIYGGHFVFVFPLLLGWLFHSYREEPKILTNLYTTILAMTVYIALNNWYRMQEFFVFLQTFYI